MRRRFARRVEELGGIRRWDTPLPPIPNHTKTNQEEGGRKKYEEVVGKGRGKKSESPESKGPRV